MSPRITHRAADHATGSTLATLAACLFVTAGALVWTSVFAAGVTLLFAGVLLLAAGWFYGRAERATPPGRATRHEELPSTVDVHETGRAHTTGAWRAYPYHLVRAVRLAREGSDAPVSHARRIAGRASGGAR